MILVEGPDGAGKTTLINQILSTVTNPYWNYIHHGLLNQPYEAYIKALYDEDADVTIIDRAWPSEMIYGLEVRGVDRLAESYKNLETIAKSRHMVMIRCLPSRATAMKNWSQREEFIKSDTQMIRIYEAYKKFTRTTLPNVLYNYEIDNAANIMNVVRLIKVKHYSQGVEV